MVDHGTVFRVCYDETILLDRNLEAAQEVNETCKKSV